MNTRTLYCILVAMFVLSACSALSPTPADPPQPLASPADSWAISLTQSGGFIGMMQTVEISSDGQLKAEDQRAGKQVTRTLPPATIARLARMYSSLLGKPAQTVPSVCADCFVYDLQIMNGSARVHMQLDDTSLADSGAGALVSLLQQLRDEALGSQP